LTSSDRLAYKPGSTIRQPSEAVGRAESTVELDPLTQAAVSLIQQSDWNWWCSLTFTRAPAIERAESAFHCWMNTLNRSTFGRNYYKRPGEGLRWIRGTERQHQRDAIHFHALIGGNPSSPISDASKIWSKLAGNAQIEVYDPSRKAAAYLVKEYATTGNLDLGGVWKTQPVDLSGYIKSAQGAE